MPNWKQLYDDTWNELVSLKTKNASLEIENQFLTEKNEHLSKQLNKEEEQSNSTRSRSDKHRQHRLHSKVQVLKQTKHEYEKQMIQMKHRIKHLKYEQRKNTSTIKLLKNELHDKVDIMTGLENDITFLKNDKYLIRMDHKLEHIQDIRNYTATNVLSFDLDESESPPKKRRRVTRVESNVSKSKNGKTNPRSRKGCIQARERWSNKELGTKRTSKERRRKGKYLTHKMGWYPEDLWRCVL